MKIRSSGAYIQSIKGAHKHAQYGRILTISGFNL